MTMLDDVLGTAVPGAKNRICTLWRRHKGKRGNDPSSTGMSLGKCLIAVLICAGTALMMSDAASAKARKGGAKASAPPALDAQAINIAQPPAPSAGPRHLQFEPVHRGSGQHDRADPGTYVADVHTDELIHDEGRPRRTWS